MAWDDLQGELADMFELMSGHFDGWGESNWTPGYTFRRRTEIDPLEGHVEDILNARPDVWPEHHVSPDVGKPIEVAKVHRPIVAVAADNSTARRALGRHRAAQDRKAKAAARLAWLAGERQARKAALGSRLSCQMR